MTTERFDMDGAAAGSPITDETILGRPRLLFIDNLRIVLTALVILHHLSIGYGGPGDWYYNEEGLINPVTSILLTLFVIVNQSFFMGFFFMVSSYLMPESYDRKGAGVYLTDRLKRLGIPMVFFAVIINPLLQYILLVYNGFQGSLWRLLSENYATGIGVGPLWFVETLLIFAIIYTALRLASKPSAVPPEANHRPLGNGVIALFALALGLVTFVVRIWLPVGWWLEPFHLQVAHFPQYIALFVVGILACRRSWFAMLSSDQGRVWLYVALALVVVLFPIIFVVGGGLGGDPTTFVGGLHWQSLAYSVWEQFLCAAIIVTLLVWFRNRFDRQGLIAMAMSRAAYAVYVFHAPVIVLLALALAGIRLELGMKFVLVAPVAVLLCFLVGHFVRKLPLARNVL